MIMRSYLVLLLSVFSGASLAAGMNDDPLLTMVKVDQFEVSDEGDLSWDAQAWLGYDLNKLWFKTEGEQEDSHLEDAEIQLLYSYAIAPYWDAQIGWRHDLKPEPNRDWLAIGVQGLAPYFFETDISLFVGKSGNIGLRTKFEYELLLSQQWILTPELEANIYSQNDRDIGIGSGLSDLSLGLRLRYEIKREFAPYIGVDWAKQFGNTADYAEEGDSSSDFKWVVRIRAWF